MNEDFPEEPDDLSKYVYVFINALIGVFVATLLFSEDFVTALKARTERAVFIRNAVLAIILLLLNIMLIYS